MSGVDIDSVADELPRQRAGMTSGPRAIRLAGPKPAAAGAPLSCAPA